jgi:RNA polymerase sigma-70 factor, ECF subfamily
MHVPTRRARRRNVEKLADEDLMPLVAERDPRALEALYDRHGGPAYSLAHRIMGERQAAEDVTQEAFVSIWKARAGYNPARGSVRSWVLAIVRNRAIDALRRSSTRAPRLDFDDDGVLAAQPDPRRTEGEAIRREDARQLRGALQELPHEQSQVIGLAYYGGFTHSEIAELLEVPLGTIKGRMRLGLGKMRESMDEAV